MNDFITIRVRSIWQGMVGVRDKYIMQARKEKKGLRILHERDKMEIPFDKLEESIQAKSTQPFYDRYSNSSHFLIYFLWKPMENKQTKLL